MIKQTLFVRLNTFSILLAIIYVNAGQPTCICIPYYNCLKNGTVNKYGIKIINPRSVSDNDRVPQCPNILDACCEVQIIKEPITPNSEKKPYVNKGCGYRNPNGIGLKLIGNTYNLAHEGEFPWMVYLFKKEHDNGRLIDTYKCGGSLINPHVVLTAAHCINKFETTELTVRAGDWDRGTDKERLPHQDRKIQLIVMHPNFDSSYLAYDFALVFLQDPFVLADNVEIACLSGYMDIIDSKKCYVSGWGTQEFEEPHNLYTVLKSVQVPLVHRNECETRLRKTRLSEYFELHNSFVCAGGEKGSDSCTGDGGSPLVCPLKGDPQRYVQTGIVAWGIGCNDEYPAVYANVVVARSWIDRTLKIFKIDTNSYIANLN